MDHNSAVHLIVGRIVRAPALGTRLSRIPAVVAVWALLLAFAGPLSAQRIFEKPERVLTLSKGASLLLENDAAIQRFSIGEPTTEVILQKIRTLAVGQEVQRDRDGKPRMVPVITVAVSPEQAETLSLAAGQGRIQLALKTLIYQAMGR